MTNKRRITLIIVSVSLGTLLSAFFITRRRGGISNDDWFMLGTNFFFALLIIFSIGYFLVWRKKR